MVLPRLSCLRSATLNMHLRCCKYCSKIDTNTTCACVCSEPGRAARTISTARGALAAWPLASRKQAIASPVRPRPAWQCTATLRHSTDVV